MNQRSLCVVGKPALYILLWTECSHTTNHTKDTLYTQAETKPSAGCDASVVTIFARIWLFFRLSSFSTTIELNEMSQHLLGALKAFCMR